MNIGNLIKIAISSLFRNKMRTALTMLGIVIGIASVIAMVSIGQASTQSVKTELSSMGSNMIMIMPARQRRGGVDMGMSTSKALDNKDLEALSKNTKYVAAVSPNVTTNKQLIYGNNNHSCSVSGVSAAYLDIRKYELKEGVMFTDDDVKRYNKVCVIGQTVVDELFTNGEDPIGKSIRFGSIPMTVIGVLESKGQSGMGDDQDDIVFAPYTTIQKRFLGITYFNMMYASATSEEESELAATEITYILRSNHGIKDGMEDDFDIRTQEELVSTISSVTKVMTTLLAAIASISLVVGGIGIMNIMYVTVTERTKEIGLRMAIGAHNRDIKLQFLCESVILSLIGGIIGIILGLIISYVASKILNMPYVVSEMAILASFIVCALTGIFFGWYPAKKAANLDPINALRYE
ncbi:MAG: ABC transporter permease [Bacteroidales bacterium]|nr:ABC transporter permease [Bacteroidales bacterium]